MVSTSTQGAVTVMSVDAPLDAECGEHLKECLLELPKLGRSMVVIDLAECPLIDSSGCEALLDLQEQLANRDGLAHLAGCCSLCTDILAATGISDHYDCFTNTREAILDFAK